MCGTGSGPDTVDLNAAIRHRHRVSGGQFDWLEGSARDHLVASQHLVDVEHGGNRDTGALALPFEVGARPVGKEPSDGRDQIRTVEPRNQIIEGGVGKLGRPPHPVEHALPLARREYADAHGTIRAGHNGIHEPDLRTPAWRFAQRNSGGRAAVYAECRIERLARPLHQREVDLVTVAGLQTVDVAQQSDVGRLHQCAFNRQVAGWQERWAPGNSRACQPAAQGVEDRRRRLPPGVRTGLPEVAYRQDDERRVLRGDIGRVQLNGLGRPGARGFDDNVGIGQQRPECCPIRRIAKIKLDGGLAQVADREVYAQSIDNRRSQPVMVAATWFNAHHLCTQCREVSADGRRGTGCEVDHVHVSKRKCWCHEITTTRTSQMTARRRHSCQATSLG